MEKDIKYFKAGDKLTAQALNDMLDDIASNEEEVNKVKQTTENVENFTSTVDQKATDAYDLADTALSGAQEAKTLAEEAKTLAEEAAQQGAQADYNENNSALASYIKNRPFYEDFAFEPITWDGVVGDKEVVDVSAIIPGSFIVKVSDTVLTYEELLDSIAVFNDGNQEKITADYMISKEEGDAMGGYGIDSPVLSIFDPELVKIFFDGTTLSKGVYFLYSPKHSLYVASLSKTIVKKIDEKFLPATALGANMEIGTGKGSSQQLPDEVADGFDFTEKNPNATNLDPTLTGIIPYGAVGDFSSAFGGKSSAQGKRSHAEGTTTIAKGDYSHAEGNNSVALGANSHAEGKWTTAYGENSHAEGFNTTAYGNLSHAECDNTLAEGLSSHAEGSYTYAKGYGSHSEGVQTQAIGDQAHAEGFNTMAEGDYSHAGGRYTEAKHIDQTVIGRYNDNKVNTLFEIGGGHADDNRFNIFEVYVNGDIGIRYNGIVYSLHKMLAAYFTDDNKKLQ